MFEQFFGCLLYSSGGNENVTLMLYWEVEFESREWKFLDFFLDSLSSEFSCLS